MKFGIEIPQNVIEAQELDAKNGNTYWQDAIKKEYNNVKVAFKLLEDNGKASACIQGNHLSSYF